MESVYDMVGSILIGGMVPESSTCTTIFGAIALAFAAYTKTRTELSRHVV